MYSNKKVAIITAIDCKTGAIGAENRMPWHIGEDLKRFKKLTMGYPVIMGRKTYESLGSTAPLKGRLNIVVSRSYKDERCLIVDSIEKAITEGHKDKNLVYVIGGAEIYSLALPYTDVIFMTLVKREDSDRIKDDSYFPGFPKEVQRKFKSCNHEPGGDNYSFVTYHRANKLEVV